jgi:hypothetical protein
MITLKEWMEVVDYRITEGDNFGWNCFGPNAYILSSWNGDQSGWSFSITFDTKDQTVFLVEACDYKNHRAYRRINPDWTAKFSQWGNGCIDGDMKDQAWDDVNFVDLDTDDDFFQKALAIKEGKSYDTRVQVPIELDDSEMFKLMTIAHERDITLNQLVAEILWERINNSDQIKKHDESKL